MTFWQSELGELSGKAEDAFTRVISVIPDNTQAIARIESYTLITTKTPNYYQIDWVITTGEFKGQHVFHKIHAFETDSKKRHRALNLMKLIYELYGITPKSSEAPSDNDLKIFHGKYAGIKIQEWSIPKTVGSGMMEGNWVSEVHKADGFKCETGVKMEVVHTVQHGVDSALTRNSKAGLIDLDSDLPF